MSVPATSLTGSGVNATSASLSAQASVKTGDAIQGQISQIKADLTALLLTAKGTLTVKASPALQAGDTISGQIVTTQKGTTSAQLSLQVTHHGQQGKTISTTQGQLLKVLSPNKPASPLPGQSAGTDIKTPQPPSQPQSQTGNNIAQSRLQAAARQGSLPNLFQSLDAPAAKTTLAIQTSPQILTGEKTKLNQTITQITRLPLRSSEPVNAQTLKQAVKQSGVFLEQKLAKLPPPSPSSAASVQPPSSSTSAGLQQDLKANMLILKHLLGQIKQALPSAQPSQSPSPTSAPSGQTNHEGTLSHLKASPTLSSSLVNSPAQVTKNTALPTVPQSAALMAPDLAQNLLDQAEGALERIKFLQLSSLSSDNVRPEGTPQSREGQPQPVTLDVPLLVQQQHTALTLTIQGDEAHHQDSQEAKAGWKVEFDVDMPQLGPLHGKIGLYGEKLNVTLWAEAQGTRALFAQMSDELALSLRELGFDIEDIQIRKGKPAQIHAPHGTLMDWSL
jgi:hypothetical protein